jgi:hypothetical protein
MAIKKIVYTFTALYDDDDGGLSDEVVQTIDLEDIIDACQGGEMIGQASLSDIQEVATIDVESELIALGNDGTFFDDFYDYE